MAEGLRQRILYLYNKYLAPNGKGVNYKKLAKDPAFAVYVGPAFFLVFGFLDSSCCSQVDMGSRSPVAQICHRRLLEWVCGWTLLAVAVASCYRGTEDISNPYLVGPFGLDVLQMSFMCKWQQRHSLRYS